MPESILQSYLSDLPLLHSWDGGKTWNTGGFDRSHLKKMLEVIDERFQTPRIIETGAGNSTIAFLLANPSKVVSICPEASLFARIEEYCIQHDIALEPLRSVQKLSQDVLPDIVKAEREFDFALIDGAHGWPMVFVDFCYLNSALRKGALLMIDDVQLHSVRELANLLHEQPGFDLIADLGKALIFAKTIDDPYLPEWNQQPYIVRMS